MMEIGKYLLSSYVVSATQVTTEIVISPTNKIGTLNFLTRACSRSQDKKSQGGATGGTLPGLALPNCEIHYRRHNTRIQERGKEKRRGKSQDKKYTPQNVAVKLNVDIVFKSTHVTFKEGNKEDGGLSTC
jgi:hypothetical protein